MATSTPRAPRPLHGTQGPGDDRGAQPFAGRPTASAHGRRAELVGTLALAGVAAAAAFDGQRFTDGLDAALAVERAPEQRISAFMSYAFEFIRTHPCRPLFESEPGFVMSYLLDNLPALRAELVRHLGDAFDAVPAVAAGTLGKDELADVIARLFASSWIIPETDDASLVQAVNRILQISSEETNGK